MIGISCLRRSSNIQGAPWHFRADSSLITPNRHWSWGWTADCCALPVHEISFKVCLDPQSYQPVRFNSLTSEILVYIYSYTQKPPFSHWSLDIPIVNSSVSKETPWLMILQTSCKASVWGDSTSAPFRSMATSPTPPVFRSTNGPQSLCLLGSTLYLGGETKTTDAILEKRLEAKCLKKGLNAGVQLHMSPVLTSRTLSRFQPRWNRAEKR